MPAAIDVGVHGCGNFLENTYQFGVEVRTSICLDDAKRGLQGHWLLVRAARGEGIENIDDGKNSGIERDLFTFEPAQIATAIELFMVAFDDFAGTLQPFRFVDDVYAQRNVGAHECKFFRRQANRLAEFDGVECDPEIVIAGV